MLSKNQIEDDYRNYFYERFFKEYGKEKPLYNTEEIKEVTLYNGFINSMLHFNSLFFLISLLVRMLYNLVVNYWKNILCKDLEKINKL